MSDGLPSDEQLRRIERGVQRRIRARRLVAQRIAGSAVAVVLVAGGIALVGPALSRSTSSGGSAASGSGAGGTASLVVVCHERGASRKAEATGRDAAAVAAACATRQQTTSGRTPAAEDGAASARPTASPAAPVLCRATSGAVHVWLDDPRPCAVHGMVRLAD